MNVAEQYPVIDTDSIRQQAESVLPPVEPTAVERARLIKEIKSLLKAKDAVLVAHYYTHDDLQMLADETGGFVADSLEMARFGNKHPASTLVVAGVRFMGETAKIINPEKRVLMPTLAAECSLDLSCPADEFNAFCDAHPDRTVVVYANTSAEVKARADWVVTSSIAARVVQHLVDQGKKILWAPDKYLGDYVQRVTGANMISWQGSCIVHERFKAVELTDLRKQYPEAMVLVHPESPPEVIAQADVVGSTTGLINAVVQSDCSTFIVATDNGILYKMRQAAPDKQLIEAPNAGIGATCRSCAHCPWMAMNSLSNLAQTLREGVNEITVNEVVRQKALTSVTRMLDFAKANL